MVLDLYLCVLAISNAPLLSSNTLHVTFGTVVSIGNPLLLISSNICIIGITSLNAWDRPVYSASVDDRHISVCNYDFNDTGNPYTWLFNHVSILLYPHFGCNLYQNYQQSQHQHELLSLLLWFGLRIVSLSLVRHNYCPSYGVPIFLLGQNRIWHIGAQHVIYHSCSLFPNNSVFFHWSVVKWFIKWVRLSMSH